MFSALVVTLREGVEAALIVGITLVYLAKIGRPDLRRTVYYALVAALICSIAGAVALSYLPITQDAFEGWVMLVAAVMVVGMIVFMMRTARKLKGEIESKVGSLAGAGSQWGLFAFVFLMVFREGIETVAILAGVSLNSTELMSFLGTLLGVALAVVFGVMFVKGSVRIDLRKFFRITVVILKNFRRSMRTLPLTNITPKTTARATPSSVPRKLMSSVELRETPARIATVSMPSRNTMRKTKAKSPHCEPVPASEPTRDSISPLSLRAVRIMKMTMETTKTAATSMIQPSSLS